MVKLPIDVHGLHRHKISCPTLATHQFFDVFPIYSQRFSKGEKCDFDLSLFGRTNPFVNAAMVTGRYTVRKFFVPHRLVFPAWYDFDAGKTHVYSSGESAIVPSERTVVLSDLSQAFVSDRSLMVSTEDGNNCDVAFCSSYTNPAVYTLNYYNFTPIGKKVYRIFRSLGIAPTWSVADSRFVSVLDILEWIKLYLDWFYPSQYVDDSDYKNLESLVKLDTIGSLVVDPRVLLDSVKGCVSVYYDQSIFDFAWDNPVSPNVDSNSPYFQLSDITSDSGSDVVYDPDSNNGSPVLDVLNDGVISQYLLDGLQSINNYIKRHQLAGNRLADRFYAERGVKLENAIIGRSLYLGEDQISLRVGDVESNSDSANAVLGELAGKGIVDSKNMTIRIKEDNFSEDGLLVVALFAVPDCPPLLYNHPHVFNISSLDHYHGSFDKLGVEAIPQNCVLTSMNGVINSNYLAGVFGFLNRYYGEVLNVGRLLGDFVLEHQGARELSKYHGFRLIPDFIAAQNQGLFHSKDFISSSFDSGQFNRFFYQSEQDNLITLVWFEGNMFKNKLPLGDSYDWDDDEENRKVEVNLKPTDNG